MRSLIAPFVVMLAVGLAGCVPKPEPRSARELVRAGIDEGLMLQDPFKLDPEIKAKAEDVVGLRGDSVERMQRLRDFLSSPRELGFKYRAATYNANEAYRARGGDCMAYTLLFVALARDLGLPVHVVHVSEVKNYYEKEGWFFVSSHVAVGFSSGAGATVIDLSKEVKKEWQLSMYESIDDSAATALFYNNVAVDHMMQGDLKGAEQMLSFLHRREPAVIELTNNLGVLLNREHRYRESLTLLELGIANKPSYGPFYTNAIHAARGAKLAELATDLERRGQKVAESDPFFLFARGMAAYEHDDFAFAARELERAADAKPDSPIILGWLTRAYFAGGDREHGRGAFERARRIAPNDPVVRDLEGRYPELR
jgi:tetratricopeptide (TPR) repeat protein